MPQGWLKALRRACAIGWGILKALFLVGLVAGLLAQCVMDDGARQDCADRYVDNC